MRHQMWRRGTASRYAVCTDLQRVPSLPGPTWRNQQICSTRLQPQEYGPSRHKDPGASWRALTGSRCGLRRLPELIGIRPLRRRVPAQVFAMHPTHCPVRLPTRSWTTGQAFAMRRTTWAQIGPNEFSAPLHSRSHPPPQPLNRSSGSQDTTSPPIWGSRGRDESRQPDQHYT
jgi:hypothetical protein